MNVHRLFIFLTLIFLLAGADSFSQSFKSLPEYKSIPYSVAPAAWNDTLGNHRAEVVVKSNGDAVAVVLPWRRRDLNPDQKRLIVTDINGREMKNIFRVNISREVGEFCFQPESGKGTYYVYYMPYKGEKNNGWFSGGYLKPEPLPDKEWVNRNHLTGLSDLRNGRFERADIRQIQSRTAFDSFYPMEVCATKKEVESIIRQNPQGYILFPEDRRFPIRMTTDLPIRWIEAKPSKSFSGSAKRNEYYTFQIGVFASKEELKDLQVSYGDSRFKVTCFNLEGVDSDGKYFKKRVDVKKGNVQPLWFGVDIGPDVAAGLSSFYVTVKPQNQPPQTIRVAIKVEEELLADRGDSELWRHSRLRWLNSTLGLDDNPVAPYTNLEVDGRTIRSGLREVSLNEMGMVKNIRNSGNELISKGLAFVVETSTGEERLVPTSFNFIKKENGKVIWKSIVRGDNVDLSIIGTMEFDGHIGYSVSVKALKNITVKDIRLDVPVRKSAAQYFMGMGLPGGRCPSGYDWKWKGPQDSYWIGDVNVGLHCELRGATYSGPLLNLYRPNPPKSWYNDNKGGFTIVSNREEVLARTYSGERQLNAGQQVNFEFALLITPLKKLDTKDQFVNRYYHNGSNPTPKMEDLSSGVRITNVHHANSVNPYINYPFIAVDSMRSFVSRWHTRGVKVKIYYTIRELTNQAVELWTLRSLGDEILGHGEGGGYPWLQEHLISDYSVQWFTPLKGFENSDAAIITSGKSRWENYYIEGLKWLVKNVDIDGLYLDDVSFDRVMLKRMRKVMDAVKPGCIMDLHSNTGFSVGPATQYTEFFPYINKLWFGESFMYNNMSPDNWLVEVSGIPFGLMGDMLHAGGNPWRGMVYGMTVRYPWYTEGVSCDPRDIWKVWDSFGIQDARMIGYWDTLSPVQASNPNVLVTSYVKQGKTLISLASWNPEKVDVTLKVDWKALGLNPDRIKMEAPYIPEFQKSMVFGVSDKIPVEPKKGWLIVVSEK